MPVIIAPASSTTYVPPAHRNKNPSISAPTLLPQPAKKNAPKKEFALEPSAFPSLGETTKTPTNRGTPISFSSAAAKKTATAPPVETVNIADNILPGWVYIRRSRDGEIQYKYGTPKYPLAEKERAADEITSRIILKNRIAREQYDRNVNIERLGDLSEFYGQPTLDEMYEKGASYQCNEDSDSNVDSDDYGDGDYN
jgi:hypothetical protein